MSTVSETDRENAVSDTEIEQWHAEDLHAARIVVGLMASVFTMGLLMYAFICWIAM